MSSFFLALLILGVIIYIGLTTSRTNSFVQSRRDTFLMHHSDAQGFLCDGQEDVGNHLVQLYGGVLGRSLKAGDQLVGLNGKQYSIKEVYADKKTPAKPSVEMPEGDLSCALVFDATDWNYKEVDARLHKDGVVLFSIA